MCVFICAQLALETTNLWPHCGTDTGTEGVGFCGKIMPKWLRLQAFSPWKERCGEDIPGVIW